MERVDELGTGSFEATVLLDLGEGWRHGATLRPITLVYGSGISIGGETMPPSHRRAELKKRLGPCVGTRAAGTVYVDPDPA